MKYIFLTSALILGLSTINAQAANPEPEFEKACAMGLAAQQHIPTDCSVNWTAENGRVYCFSNEEAKAEFVKDAGNNVQKAEIFWTGRMGN